MSRQKLSEFRAKSLLLPHYGGVSLRSESLQADITQLQDEVKYVVKVDQGIKKRGKQGLIRLNVAKKDVTKAVKELTKKGFNRFVAEPMVPHSDEDERYLSFERTRDGIVISYSEKGGIDIEDSPESVKQYSISDAPLPEGFAQHVVNVMNRECLAFVEINPLLVSETSCLLLDAAVLADSAGEYRASWTDDDVVEAHTPTASEATIAQLNNNSPAAFSFRVLNPDGALWLLLSGGGASITIADEAMNQGKADLIGNYGEYSGGPSTEETYLYTKAVLKQVFASKSKKKALVIAGGVANFTDVKKTFRGVIQALEEEKDLLTKQKVKVYVRRGEPNEAEGLALMKEFLESNKLFGSVHGSDIVLTDVINEALEYVNA